ncbi:hypothetical protein OG455_07440 [Kitasatospora sp. NBC_01287]|uniref:hypothetical protein n=1 Tax=Kitasatospora sp. NBC_01287 TaxID=2903573 RepID=UPI0022560991|nr:hypothetical protein [Kitasatospora sp. NBC_01287]MCX4745358.1 hypothetical protein [Kitasatospora sp. NBC_01287]
MSRTMAMTVRRAARCGPAAGCGPVPGVPGVRAGLVGLPGLEAGPVGGQPGGGGGAGQPVAVAVAADPVDHRRLRGLGLFGAEGFGRYLRRTEAQLRAMARHGVEVHLRVLEPADYADFCAVRGLAPGEAVARVAYAADPELAGAPFVYGGERLAALLPELVDDHLARVRISLALERLRQAVGGAAGPAARALAHAELLLGALIGGLGEGCHLLGLAVPGGAREAAGEMAEPGDVVEVRAGCGHRRGCGPVGPRAVEAFRAVLAAGLAEHRGGELLARSGCPPARARTVRGWALGAGGLVPLDASGVRAALARPPGLAAGPVGGPVRVRAGFALPGGRWGGGGPVT